MSLIASNATAAATKNKNTRRDPPVTIVTKAEIVAIIPKTLAAWRGLMAA